MNRTIKLIVGILCAAMVLTVASICVLRFSFGIDVFDRSGWRETKNGGIQYLTYEGTPLAGWQTIEGETYYFDPEADCTMATGWLELESRRYYLGASGTTSSGWLELNGNRYFLEDDGAVATGWLELEGTRWYLGENGAVQTGWLEQPEGFYYLDDEGKMATGLTELDTGTYYLAQNGIAHIGWLKLDGQQYYFGEDRAVCTGWLELDDGTYYFGEDGVMQTGWVQLDGKRWYLDDSGKVYTGWLETDEGLYWFREDGVMAVGRVTIDGVERYFTSTGKYVVLVNRWNPVPEDYETELVAFRGFQVSAAAHDAMGDLVDACNEAGFYCGVNSVYRSYEFQNSIWSEQVERYVARGYSRENAIATTNRSIAVPGTSEHQLGLAIDMDCGNDAYAWLAQNSWRYGFILRYPYGATEWTGILYEPWHFRYVGVELAKELYDLGLCMEEYMDRLTEQAGYEPHMEAA